MPERIDLNGLTKANRGLQTVRVSKDDLLKKVTANRKQHVEDYNEAMEGLRDHLQGKIDNPRVDNSTIVVGESYVF